MTRLPTRRLAGVRAGAYRWWTPEATMGDNDETATTGYTDHEARALLRVRWHSLPEHLRKTAIDARNEDLVSLLDAAASLFEEYGFKAARIPEDRDYQEPWAFVYPDNVQRTVALRINYAGEVQAYYPRLGQDVPEWSAKLTYDPAQRRFYGPKTTAVASNGSAVYRSALDEIVRAVLKALYRD